MVNLPGVKIIQEWHHQALTQVDLHQGHGYILPALDRGHLLQHGQRTAVLHLVRSGLRSNQDTLLTLTKRFFVIWNPTE